MRVLVLEDTGELMSVVTDRLREGGAHVEYAPRTMQALARASHYDHVVLLGILWSPDEARAFLPRMLLLDTQ